VIQLDHLALIEDKFPSQLKITLVASRMQMIELCQKNTKEMQLVTTSYASILLELMVLDMPVSSMVANVGLEMTMINMARYPIANAA
jgi:hypothetical protein